MFIPRIDLYLAKIKGIFKKYKLEKGRYKYSLIDVTTENSEIVLHVILMGIKKQVLKLNPQEIVYDDELLSEFSPCDVRAITYLAFQKYMNQEQSFLIIEYQYINEGVTTFRIKNIHTNELLNINAQKIYQDYDFLINLSRKDMIMVISSAVQEQTILDIKSMEMS
ncbi:hypothetical protein Lnau_2310 [Legionella nautarum]|uniref:Uncharacterized protein n=1 Tax=Legionella nautarum TaxID=45070 RepID=A0A0W0WMK7_9GAMM|nr:hypothetical protein [Legionella nautarum]KTD33559.1 hypothetical protein Lnau_2310 [Legionella nautarum]